MTREEYLNAVSHLIGVSQRDATTGLKASTLGNLILRSLPERWQQHGYPNLRTLLGDLEQLGEIRVGLDAQKMLAVWGAGKPALPSEKATPRKPVRIKREVWNAFVSSLPPGLRFMHRTKGSVLMGQTRSPTAPGDWVLIPQLSQETQKGWASDLIEQHHLEDLSETLHDQSWYVRFPEKLWQVRKDLLVLWNQTRTSRVADAIVAWCDENGIARELVTDALLPVAREAMGAHTRSQVQCDNTRQRLLAALSRMPTSELLEIPIPGKYIFGRENG